jgi:hypothetical protein
MMKKNYMAIVICMALLMVSVLASSCSGATQEEGASGTETDVRQILDTMSTEQKVAQMIMPAIRTWDEEDVTDLSAVPALAEALRRHQYGGIILFGANVKNSDQTVRLISDLQSNHAKSGDAAAAGIIPYENAESVIVIDAYYDIDSGELIYSDALSASIRNADAVIALSAVGAGMDLLQDDSPIMQGVTRALSEAHESGAKFVLLSDNLPVDAARFQEADTIVCAYLSAGFGIDPTARTSGSENIGAFNANVPAAIRAIFGAADMPGRLPIDIPALEKDTDGRWV